MSTANPMKSYRRYKGGRPKSTAKKLLSALLAIVLVCVVAFGALLGCVLYGGRDQIQGDPQVMIVLGCQVMPSGNPSVLLRDRLDEALDYLEEHPDMTVVVSGGQGGNEPTTEADAMADYLISNGILEENILRETESGNTWQNLILSLELLEENGYDTSADIVVVSNGFHLTRVRMLWTRLTGESDLSTLAAPSSHLPARLYMYIREPLALAKSFFFDRG